MEINKWCHQHWDMLREAIFARGMEHLVPKSGEAALAMMADELTTGSARDVEGFDPLMRSYWAISSRVMEDGGNPFECPLCQIQRHADICSEPKCHQQTVEQMVGSCTDSMRNYVKSKGLMRANG